METRLNDESNHPPDGAEQIPSSESQDRPRIARIWEIFVKSARNWRIVVTIVLYSTIGMYSYYWNPPTFYSCRGNRPNNPEFNGYLLSYTGGTCHDVPLIDLEVLDSSGRNGRVARTAAEHERGIKANPGDLVRVLIWFHNSGSEKKRSETTATGVRVGTTFDKTPSVTHTISAYISASNAESIDAERHGGLAVVTTSVPTILEPVLDSARVCLQAGDALERGLGPVVSCGDFPDGKIRYAAKIPDAIVNGSEKIGDLRAGDSHSGYVQIHLRVKTVGDTK
jgi:hypothetical protein